MISHGFPMIFNAKAPIPPWPVPVTKSSRHFEVLPIGPSLARPSAMLGPPGGDLVGGIIVVIPSGYLT